MPARLAKELWVSPSAARWRPIVSPRSFPFTRVEGYCYCYKPSSAPAAGALAQVGPRLMALYREPREPPSLGADPTRPVVHRSGEVRPEATVSEGTSTAVCAGWRGGRTGGGGADAAGAGGRPEGTPPGRPR